MKPDLPPFPEANAEGIIRSQVNLTHSVTVPIGGVPLLNVVMKHGTRAYLLITLSDYSEAFGQPIVDTQFAA
jgi:hypothetical protein